MAKSWINDRWLTDAVKILDDGSKVHVPPSSAVKRALSMHVNDPEKAKVPAEFRTSVFGQGARWTVFWTADGERHRKNFRDYRKADEFRAGLEDDIRSARYVNPKDAERTFGEVAEIWIAGLRGSIKQSTEARYLRELRIWVLPRWGMVPLGRIGTATVQRWVAQLVSGDAPRDGRIGQARPLAPKSIRSIVKIVFKAVLDLAVSNGWLMTNPVDRVKLPRALPMHRRIYLTPIEVKAIADEMSDGNAIAVYLLAYTGARIGELLALRCGDVDLDRMAISITKTQSVDVGNRTIETTPKGNRSRTVPIPDGLRPGIIRLIDGHGSDEYLVRAPRGGMQTTQNWRNRIWFPALRAAGMDDIDGLTIHSLRHTYASLAIKAGADVKTLQAVMGHASAAETLDTYADLWPSRTGEVAAAINKEILL
ncbi:tyrosine-type recombinase/integrase [Bifidobacterium pseudolongum]|uniref:Integrase/recombinase n=1 Tax=Bifidobacterium pseudolongum subsp. globosum TaxID=1690 RepID=A0A4Q5AJ70_9BIFI|nr:site-specific integrase [Bifidobacterium pseudolongum]PKV03211.1 phage integrase family protein [Bifidobacterium pseudolongum subsp. globosum]RYP96204.1 Integrase/recombinase [Bifidobacterium pseudolongum subsp. globosum]RYQ21390.1 Integrase/recombinase [Bifidobacterium pseudolongum subsp. globosum]RYQ29956.1 Integrase/recombinase [Bifidobacterium pseudolongum subsp. globosum]RYQ74019.1 Integrase/recombinase [Bifidobacterium pseudolongum subsp. globosum]